MSSELFNVQGSKTDVFREIQGTELYAITIKVLHAPKNADEKTYEPYFKVLYHLAQVVCICGEKDGNNRFHYHGTIRIPVGFYRKQLCMKGFHIKLTKIYDAEGWLRYCFKNEIYTCFASVEDILDKLPK